MSGLDWSKPGISKPEQPESALKTSGYGDDHIWDNLGVMPRRTGMYNKYRGWRCLNCRAYFRHFFTLPAHEDIHRVIERAGIPHICPRNI